jgi:hypothetical protein
MGTCAASAALPSALVTAAHDNASGTVAEPSTALIYAWSAGLFIYRLFALFDTSSLTASANISAATASFYINGTLNSDNDGDDWVNVVQSAPASNTDLVLGDFSKCGDAVSNPTEGSTRVDITGISSAAYLDFALNATGRGWISKTGVTKLGLREGHDCINSAAVANDYVEVKSAETAGTTSDPKLVVTYALGTTTSTFSMMGV